MMQLFPSALQFSEQLFPSALQFSERRFYTCSHPSHAQVVGTARSGSGAPCHALAQLVGDANYKELFASEIHAPWVHDSYHNSHNLTINNNIILCHIQLYYILFYNIVLYYIF